MGKRLVIYLLCIDSTDRSVDTAQQRFSEPEFEPECGNSIGSSSCLDPQMHGRGMNKSSLNCSHPPVGNFRIACYRISAPTESTMPAGVLQFGDSAYSRRPDARRPPANRGQYLFQTDGGGVYGGWHKYQACVILYAPDMCNFKLARFFSTQTSDW